MRPYLAQIAMNLKLTSRDRSVLFFNYAFPLVFFFMFGSLYRAEQGGVITEVVTMVLAIGILANGFFGAGMRSVADREQNILRRFKVAPISAAPILVSSLVTGLLNYIPSVVMILALAHWMYGMPAPSRPLSLLIFISLGIVAFRSLGLIIASVVNSMQESQILVQILYLPMLFLSGATIPITVLPYWVQVIAQFLPATYLVNGLQAILNGKQGLAENWEGMVSFAITLGLATFLGMKLFRWDKDDKIGGRAKLWVVAVLAPFIVLGAWQSHSRESIAREKILARQVSQSRTRLIRNARIFVGDGRVIETGSVLVKDGKVAEVYVGQAPDAKALKAEVIEAAGKTLLPGLIDVHVHLSAPGGVFPSNADYNVVKTIPREMAAYLYSGVTEVKSVGDPLDAVLKERTVVNSGERLGAELFLCGPMFTTVGGHGTEYFKNLPANTRDMVEAQTVRLPRTPEEARRMVDDLKKKGVDGIKAILEAGETGMLFNRMSVPILDAIGAESKADRLPMVVHTGDAKDVADALDAGAVGIEHGSFRDAISDELFARMKAGGVTYDPTLVVAEAFGDLKQSSIEPLERPLVLQVGPASLIEATKKYVLEHKRQNSARARISSLEQGRQNLLRAYHDGVTLVTGTDSGNFLVVHGPAVHRELQLWVEAGIPPPAALRAATYNGAKLLRKEDRIGLIARGHDANLLLVDGNPLAEIKQTEAIQTIVFRGEVVSRSDLFDQQ